MRYLVTGGLGVIGSLFARELLTRGHDVVVLDPGGAQRHVVNQIGIHQALGLPGCGKLEVVECSTMQDDSRWTGQRFDRVIHAGASTGIPFSGEDPLEDWECNATGTLSLLEWLRAQNNPPPTVVLSSVKPYKLHGSELTGTEALEPDEPYAASKAAQSMLCMAWGRSYNLPVLTLRCSNLYGPAACHGPRHGWLTWFCIQAAGLGQELEVQGTGNQARDMLWWTDVLNAVDKGHTSLEMGLIGNGDILTIGGGTQNMITVGQAARKLQAMTGCRFREAPDKGRAHEDDWVAVDNEAASRAFSNFGGFEPQVGVQQGMRQLVEWASEHKSELEEAYV